MRRGIGTAALVAVLLSVDGGTALLAHEERASQFPAGTGTTPTYRTRGEAAEVVVVCKPDSGARIAVLTDPARRAENLDLLPLCQFEHLQAAVDSVRTPRTNVYVLPGIYREEPSWSAECIAGYDGGVVSYELIHRCGEVIDLVTIAGDDPADPDIACDNSLCHLQIEGTGSKPGDVVFTGGSERTATGSSTTSSRPTGPTAFTSRT